MLGKIKIPVHESGQTITLSPSASCALPQSQVRSCDRISQVGQKEKHLRLCGLHQNQWPVTELVMVTQSGVLVPWQIITE